MSGGGRVPICVFAKAPIPGQVKTRLAASLGEQVAALLAQAFLEDTWAGLEALPWVHPVLATTAAVDHRVPGFAFAPRAEVWLQPEGDLGARMEGVLDRALGSSSTAFVLGADAPGLPARILEEAREALETFDAVLGPAADGGFYLLGLRHCPAGLLEDLPWSHPDTCQRTQARLESRGLRVHRTPEWFDVDTLADLQRLARLLERGEILAPRTAHVLGSVSAAGLQGP